jgi:hypothetical protein
VKGSFPVIIETIRRLTGTRPIGWYIGTPSANTRRLVVEEGGFLYDSDAYNDELPYWTYDYGRPHLIIPHTLDDNDTRLGRGLGWGQAEDFFVSLRDNFDALHREGEQTPKMMTVAVHCRLAGKPARAAAFARSFLARGRAHAWREGKCWRFYPPADPLQAALRLAPLIIPMIEFIQSARGYSKRPRLTPRASPCRARNRRGG